MSLCLVMQDKGISNNLELNNTLRRFCSGTSSSHGRKPDSRIWQQNTEIIFLLQALEQD